MNKVFNNPIDYQDIRMLISAIRGGKFMSPQARVLNFSDYRPMPCTENRFPHAVIK